MNQDPVSSALALAFVTLISLAIALLFFVYVVGTLSAIGIARERGREGRAVAMAIFAFLVPVVGWFCVFSGGAPVRWVRRYFWAGLASLVGAAVLSYVMIQRGIVAP